jgi:hypothetical protein|tara:strand:+ start:106 stop:627 length:522 start_codon:yes stop_codon:yes gene_type:complete
MLNTINSFAGFNLSAILFAIIGGGIFVAIFHYALLPILNIILIKPLASIVYNTYSFFSKDEEDKNEQANNNVKKKGSSLLEKFANFFKSFFIIKSLFLLFFPFIILIYLIEANAQNISPLIFDQILVFDTLVGSGIFLAVVVLVSLVAMSFKMNFKESFPLTFVFLLFLGLIS